MELASFLQLCEICQPWATFTDVAYLFLLLFYYSGLLIFVISIISSLTR